MDIPRFDRLTRTFSRARSRRGLVGAAGLVALGILDLADARKKRRRKRKKRKKQRQLITFNDFGCVSVGSFCQNNDQCCSGICQGEQDQNLQTCQGHNTSDCQGEDACADDIGPRSCTTVTEAFGFCHITTGQASYCGASVRCHTCTQDADCVSTCGAGAACVVCADSDCRELGYRTACASTVTNGCYTTI